MLSRKPSRSDHLGKAKGGQDDAVIGAIADRMAISVGAALAELVPGRVSTEVDADLSFDTKASIEKAHQIVAGYKNAASRRTGS